MTFQLSVRPSLAVRCTLILLAGCGGGGDPGPDPGVPTAIEVAAGNGQIAVHGMPLATAPSVLLTNARGPVADVEVVFTLMAGGGTITGAVTRTNTQGIATLGGWTLGPVPGANRIRAIAAGSLSTEIDATGVAGWPATLTISQGDGQHWVEHSLVPTPLAVVVTDGEYPVPGATVTFAVTDLAGGSVTGGTQVTAANGLAIVGGWRLGQEGENTLTARVDGTPLVVTATATAERLVISQVKLLNSGLEGFAGSFSAKQVGVEVSNQFNRPADGIPVAFSIASGGGKLTGGSTVTGADGQAMVGSWRYGSASSQSIQAIVGAEPPVTLFASAVTPSFNFQPSIVFPDGQPGAGVSNAFARAAGKWQSLIVGDLPSITLSGANGIGPVKLVNGQGDSLPCIPRVTDMVIDDISIYAYVRQIDGAGGIIGFAAPIYIRNSYLPIAGCMVFDEDDVEAMINASSFDSVVLHEMAHVFGFGTIWQPLKLIQGACPTSTSPSFSGVSSRQAYLAALPAGVTPGYPFVPVEGEGQCDDGTRDGHWSESLLGNELMTGYVQPGVNPLSAITAASMRDLGYIVSDAPSDVYLVPQAPSLRAGAPGSTELRELQVRAPLIVIDGRGQMMQVLDR